jgi:hypothetical protein
VSSELSRDQLRQLTKLGASVRLAEIKRERIALNAILNGNASADGPMQRPSVEPVRRRSRRRVTWTAAQRKAVSARMKKYWAKRRATAKKVHAKRVTPA